MILNKPPNKENPKSPLFSDFFKRDSPEKPFLGNNLEKRGCFAIFAGQNPLIISPCVEQSTCNWRWSCRIFCSNHLRTIKRKP
jgi:hypothetical protein